MHRKLTFLFLLVLLALPLATAAAQTQNDVIGFVNTGALNLRPIASATNNEPIAEIPRNYSIIVLGRTPDNTWYYVSYDPSGYTPLRGWVSGRYIVLSNGTLEMVPILGSESTTIYATGVINTGALNIRSVPGATNNIPVATLYQGSTLDIIGRSNDSAWLQIIYGYGDRIGWARSTYVTITSGSLQNAPIVSNYTQPHTPTPIATAQGIVNTGALNIRTVPHWWGNTPITFIYRNTPMTLIGRNADSSWYKVQLGNGVIGWARSRYVNVNTGNTAALPIVN
jgi:uncharacterized protein YgiM (DUF1202 family)